MKYLMEVGYREVLFVTYLLIKHIFCYYRCFNVQRMVLGGVGKAVRGGYGGLIHKTLKNINVIQKHGK